MEVRENEPHLNVAIARQVETDDLVALIEKCADVNSLDACGNSPLSAAIVKDCPFKIIRALVEKGAKVDVLQNNTTPSTPLHDAFNANAKKSVILYLLKHAVNVNAADIHKRTLLHLCFETARDIGIWKILVKKGADLEALDDRGRTPLHVAIDSVNNLGNDMKNCLIKKTKNVNSTDSEENRTLLHAAIEGRCKYDVIRALVDKGANVDAQDGEGLTPLHTALNCSYRPNYDYTCQTDKLSLYYFLIEKTSDINARDKDNRTPLYYAFLRKHPPEVIEALVDKGADFNCPDGSVFRLATDKERLPLLTKTFPEDLEQLKKILVTCCNKTTLYDALVLGRPLDWNRVDWPLKCFTNCNKPFWSVIMSSIVAQRSFSLCMHSGGIKLDEDSTLRVISFLENYDVVNLLLAYSMAKNWCGKCKVWKWYPSKCMQIQACLQLKRPSNSPLCPTVKRKKKL